MATMHRPRLFRRGALRHCVPGPARIPPLRVAALLILPLLVVSCQDAGQDRGGVETHEIVDFERLTPDWVAADIRDVVVEPGGGVWVLSSFEPHVTRLSSAGEHSLEFGQAGEGPGELRNPWYLARDPDGIAVYDVGSRRLKRYSAEGDFLGAIDAPVSEGMVSNRYGSANYGEPSRVHRAGGAWIFETYGAVQVTHPGALWGGRLVAVRGDGNPPEPLIEYDTLVEEAPTDSRLLPRAPLWTTCEAGEVRVLNPIDSTLVEIDPEGGEPRRTRIPLELPPLQDAVLQDYVDLRLAFEMREQNIEVEPADLEQARRGVLEQMREEAPDVLPPTRLLCDSSRRMWVAGFGLESGLEGYGRTWRVYDGEALTGIVTFPEGVRPLHVGEEQIVGVWQDEFDVQHLVVMANPL